MAGPPSRDATALTELVAALPAQLRHQAVTHSSWAERRADSYGRLAFLGDAVLGLAVAEHLMRRHPRSDIGRLTKIHGQAVSGRACAEVAHALGLPEMLREAERRASAGGIEVEELLASERALATACEAVIGAVHLEGGYEEVAPAVVGAFSEQIEAAAAEVRDFKSALQELLARAGDRVSYEVTEESGPAHARRFVVEARVEESVVGRGEGPSKKAAEQEAAREALERLRS